MTLDNDQQHESQMQFRFIQIKLTGLGQGKVQMTGYRICPIYHAPENDRFIA
jgi:hypothetical protein